MTIESEFPVGSKWTVPGSFHPHETQPKPFQAEVIGYHDYKNLNKKYTERCIRFATDDNVHFEIRWEMYTEALQKVGQ